MTQEGKKLLIRDLCTRLPYGVKGIITCDESNTTFIVEGIDNDVLHLSDAEECYAVDFKPYLRPMSSMTEEEKTELLEVIVGKDGVKYFQILSDGRIDSIYDTFWVDFNKDATISYLDWFNKKGFDYRDLIEKGLALPAPVGMY